jgi:hypothetical protein
VSTSETMSNEGMALNFGFQSSNFEFAEREIPGHGFASAILMFPLLTRIWIVAEPPRLTI